MPTPAKFVGNEGVTPAMVAAVAAELSGYRPGWEPVEEITNRLYRVMASGLALKAAIAGNQ